MCVRVRVRVCACARARARKCVCVRRALYRCDDASDYFPALFRQRLMLKSRAPFHSMSHLPALLLSPRWLNMAASLIPSVTSV
jgi:hypothetical protein